ncbi:MAG TPA: hypothetical protein DDZ88_05090 [Verrucomicrobiales bacterium]|nr:hypothetical protein [Verrucomicrobiales bacterium]
MHKNLTIDEMLLAASRSKMPGAKVLIGEALALSNALANELSSHLRVNGPQAEIGFESNDDIGILVSFSPREAGGACPPVLMDFDTESDWGQCERESRDAEQLNAYTAAVLDDVNMVASLLAAYSTVEKQSGEALMNYLSRCIRADFSCGGEGCLFPRLYSTVTQQEPALERERG